MALGNILRTTREQQGLTTSQVADATHMMVQIVEELEREDFRRFAAAIYGRGFVRLYAEHLGIDPAPLVKEFGELYAGARRPRIATRVLQTVPEADEEQPASTAPAASTAATPANSAPAPVPTAKPGAAAPLLPEDQEATAEIFAPAQQENAAPAARPDTAAAVDPARDLDLFSAMAAHAFGGEPVQAPTRKEPRPKAATTQRQTASMADTPEHQPLASAVLGPDQPRAPRLAERLANLRYRIGEILPAPCRNRPLLAGAAALLLLALLLAGALLLARRTPDAQDAPDTKVTTSEQAATAIRLLPPPDTYVD